MDKLLPLRTRLRKFQATEKIRWEILEKDYFLSWILYAIAQDPSLAIVFKGGTALKKCYFGAYRFSEDLDFTTLAGAPKNFETSIERLTQKLSDLINKIEPFKVVSEKYEEKESHQEGQEAYIFKGMFEWHRASHVKVFVEISRHETLCFAPVHRTLYHEYGEKLDAQILCYSLEEIILEKLRGILQHTQKMHERAWSRSRVRDYYDLWKILTTYDHKINLDNLKAHLVNKCTLKRVTFSNASSFFDEVMIAFVEATWQKWLEPLLSDLPPCKLVIKELKPLIAKIVD
jgi:uncharacterized protein